MKSLANLVGHKTLKAILVPAGFLGVGLALFVVWSRVDTAGKRVANRGADQAHSIARFLEVHRSTWMTRLLELEAASDRDALASFWGREVPEFCLESIWDSTGKLIHSWPERDIVPPPALPGGGWTGVETHPRCSGPVVRTAFGLDGGRTGVVVFRLGNLIEQIRPIDRPGTGFSSLVVDSAGYSVLEWVPSGVSHSDPQGRKAAGGMQTKGVYLENATLIAWSSHPVPSTPWILLVKIGAAEILGQILPLFLVLMIGSMLLLLLSRRMALSVAATVSTALQELSQRVRGVEEERWERSGRGSTLSEIEGLCGEFDRMAELVAGREKERRLELEARTAQLERALREMETFSYSVSHDLRAPLRAIDGFSRVLEEDAEERLLPEEKDALFRIRRATGRMEELIDDLLALSKATRSPLARRKVDMGALVREIVEQITEGEPARRIRWDVGELGMVTADPGLVRQVWMNLLSNAHKFTARRGDDAEISVRAQVVEGATRWTVSDNGVGFDRAGASKLFQPFRRMHDDLEFKGTGIGLAIVQRIVERHGGKVEIESKPGEGTMASFTLPHGGGEIEDV